MQKGVRRLAPYPFLGLTPTHFIRFYLFPKILGKCVVVISRLTTGRDG
jgi:hypothetical protein